MMALSTETGSLGKPYNIQSLTVIWSYIVLVSEKFLGYGISNFFNIWFVLSMKLSLYDPVNGPK